MTESLGIGLIIAGTLVAFYMAWNVGANDVANAMGTSVGSGALTLKRAVIVAGVFEFAGAFLLGGNVSDTIRKGIVDPELFASRPEFLAFGMLAALMAAAVWLNLATWLGMPVSTTHAIVGAVAGFGLLEFGLVSVDWPLMATIAASWFVSPLFGGFLGFIMFQVIKRNILDRADPASSALRAMPYLFFVVFATLIFAIFKKGAKNAYKGAEMAPPSTQTVILISASVAAALALIVTLIVRRTTRLKEGEDPYAFVERIFVHLQVLTACYVALAHGANDVANAVGPFAAVIHIAREGTVQMTVAMPPWVLALGGVGIVVGLATYGYRVMETVGRKIIEMSPTRGFAAEFGAATTVLIASMRGVPISTTHTLVGAVVGVGLARGMGALNRRVLYGIAASWFITVPVAALLSVVFYAILRAVLG